MQEEFLGEESLGEKYVQEEFLGEESLGEKYMGEKYVQGADSGASFRARFFSVLRSRFRRAEPLARLQNVPLRGSLVGILVVKSGCSLCEMRAPAPSWGPFSGDVC